MPQPDRTALVTADDMEPVLAISMPIAAMVVGAYRDMARSIWWQPHASVLR
jgi:hypothetical protein